jgi:hypothetical protein
VQVTEESLSSADRSALSQHVHECCIATMYMQAAILDFDMSTHQLTTPPTSEDLSDILSLFSASDVRATSCPNHDQPKTGLHDSNRSCVDQHDVNTDLKVEPMQSGDTCMRSGELDSGGDAEIAATWATNVDAQNNEDAFLKAMVHRCRLLPSANAARNDCK